MEINADAKVQNFHGSIAFSNKIPNTMTLQSHDELLESLVPFTQVNGRKVLGPPENWIGPPPTSACELYVRRIPKHLSEHVLMEQFLRIGQIYEIRVPIEYNNLNRGFAYIKYTNQEDAACAIEVLNHYFVAPGRKFEIVYSYEKSRLFVSNVPRNLSEEEIENKLRNEFPSMVRISFRNGTTRNDNATDMTNRGHVFVHFANHIDAFAAKKSLATGIIRLWNRDLKVVWAESDRDCNASPTTKTLFVRHVDLTVNNKDLIELLLGHVPRSAIQKVSKVRTSAFIDFDTREAAETCLRELQGTVLRGQRLEFEWARPSEKQSLHRMRNIDFDAMLRLKCIANGWNIPIILFGTYFHTELVQYATIVLRDKKGTVRATYCILQCSDLTDIHSRLCEVVCALIETIGTFPDYNYTFLVEKENAHLLGMVVNNGQLVEFLAANGVPHEFKFDFNEIIDLSCAIFNLTSISEELLLELYHESFRSPKWANYLPNMLVYGHRIFGTILPKYRNKAPLNYHLNDTQIVMALCYLQTGSNQAIPSRPFVPFSVAGHEADSQVMKYVKLKLLPLAISQYNWASYQWMSHIIYGENKFYHQAQRALRPPFYITGCSYSTSIKQPRLSDQQQQQQQNAYQGMQSNQTFIATTGDQSEQLNSHPPQQHFLSQPYQPQMFNTPNPPTNTGTLHF